MTRQTSREVYAQIEAEGLLDGWRWKVYQAIFRSGPCTSAEAHAMLPREPSTTKNDVATRISELKAMGAVREVGTRKCRVTGRKVLEVDVTDKVPQPMPKKATRGALINLLREAVGHCPMELQDEIKEALEGEPDWSWPAAPQDTLISWHLFDTGENEDHEGIRNRRPDGSAK